MGATWVRYLIGVLMLAVIAVAGVLAFRQLSPQQQERDYSRTRLSQNGVYEVSIAPDEEPLAVGKLQSLVLTVKTKDGDAVADATITVDGGMPEHGHGLPTDPQVTGNLGGGRYRLEGLRFNMGGWWVLRFDISSPAGDDTAEFNLKL